MRNDAIIAAKRERRARLEAELGAKQQSLPDKRYGVIYADPPWRFEPYSRITGMDRAAENHYPTSPLAEIKALNVQSIAARDCVLFLWATVPMLVRALEVMKDWGFEYKSQVIWAKDRVGTGYWFRNQHEILLVGTRGHVPAPAMGTQWSSLIQALVRRHSEKPEVFREMIEGYFPTLPKIELHARGPVARPGWDVWGLEAPGPAAFGAESFGGRQPELEMAGELLEDLSSTFGVTPHLEGSASEDRRELPKTTAREASGTAQDALCRPADPPGTARPLRGLH
jgi:N6-adenosine-specific RNA methylase IME4